MKNSLKNLNFFQFSVMGILLLACAGLGYYFHVIHRVTIVYTHLFYVPIVLSSIWWGLRGGLYVSLFLGLIHIGFALPGIGWAVFLRFFALVFVGTVVGGLCDIKKRADEALKRHTENLEERVKERTAELEGQTLELETANERLNREIAERKEAEEELRKYRDKLEELVTKRTDQLEEKAEELEQANIRLQEIDRLKSMFIASMSHELRTPLNSIIGFTGIILQGMTGEITEEQRKQLTIVKNSSIHLLALINDIIDVSKIEAGKEELAIVEFDLAALAQEVTNSFTVTAHKKGINMSIRKPPTLTIESDKRRTKQVIANLVSNAVKFTDKGEIEINLEKKAGLAEVSVMDTGVGIRREAMDKLFKAFSQILTEGRLNEGTGLGLYLSKKISSNLGGEITVESEFGKGSKFIFTLPLYYKEVSHEKDSGRGR